jgi:hypothetical protein
MAFFMGRHAIQALTVARSPFISRGNLEFQ